MTGRAEWPAPMTRYVAALISCVMSSTVALACRTLADQAAWTPRSTQAASTLLNTSIAITLIVTTVPTTWLRHWPSGGRRLATGCFVLSGVTAAATALTVNLIIAANTDVVWPLRLVGMAALWFLHTRATPIAGFWAARRAAARPVKAAGDVPADTGTDGRGKPPHLVNPRQI